jgi:hypothetical protein
MCIDKNDIARAIVRLTDDSYALKVVDANCADDCGKGGLPFIQDDQIVNSLFVDDPSCPGGKALQVCISGGALSGHYVPEVVATANLGGSDVTNVDDGWYYHKIGDFVTVIGVLYQLPATAENYTVEYAAPPIDGVKTALFPGIVTGKNGIPITANPGVAEISINGSGNIQLFLFSEDIESDFRHLYFTLVYRCV